VTKIAAALRGLRQPHVSPLLSPKKIFAHTRYLDSHTDFELEILKTISEELVRHADNYRNSRRLVLAIQTAKGQTNHHHHVTHRRDTHAVHLPRLPPRLPSNYKNITRFIIPIQVTYFLHTGLQSNYAFQEKNYYKVKKI
jgi:hypothetical protein